MYIFIHIYIYIHIYISFYVYIYDRRPQISHPEPAFRIPNLLILNRVLCHAPSDMSGLWRPLANPQTKTIQRHLARKKTPHRRALQWSPRGWATPSERGTPVRKKLLLSTPLEVRIAKLFVNVLQFRELFFRCGRSRYRTELRTAT